MDTDEDYIRENASFTGIPEVMYQFFMLICSASGYPMTRLFGVSPSGLNSTGDGDTYRYYEYNPYADVQRWQGWTKYCTSSYHGYNGFTDGKTELDLSDDVAHVRMGAPWRMPSHEQQMELMNNCSCQWTTQNGVNGILVTGPNGGQVFLPAAEARRLDHYFDIGGGWNVYYWSSSLYPRDDYQAYYLHFYIHSDHWVWSYDSRYYGLSVRAVRP